MTLEQAKTLKPGEKIIFNGQIGQIIDNDGSALSFALDDKEKDGSYRAGLTGIIKLK